MPSFMKANLVQIVKVFKTGRTGSKRHPFNVEGGQWNIFPWNLKRDDIFPWNLKRDDIVFYGTTQERNQLIFVGGGKMIATCTTLRYKHFWGAIAGLRDSNND